jgi:hypothetical protein
MKFTAGAQGHGEEQINDGQLITMGGSVFDQDSPMRFLSAYVSLR